jgi:outer membrane biosynthesis protein TonB
MHEGVSDIIAERAQLAAGMSGAVSRMLMLSLAAHAVLVAALLFAPGFFTGAATHKATPMMISLGGAEGPDTGGMNSISTRAVQRVAEPDAKPERPTPPADTPPEMVAPAPVAKPAPRTPAKPIEKPKENASSRKPTSGAAVAPGTGRVENPNASPVPFGGLSTGGGGTGGVRTNVENFCCPTYLGQIVSQIKRNWSNRQGLAGQNSIKFVIRRDGTITGIEVDESGGQLLDIASMRALQVTGKVTPLPAEFTPNTLTIYLIFEYSR